MAIHYWLVKQEPESYSWDQFVKDGGTDWTGIRNYQSRNYLRAMKRGDWVYYYHSVSEKRIVGIAMVTREHFADPTARDGDWSAVSLKPIKPCQKPVTLDQIKRDKTLETMLLVRNTRLSTIPLTAAQSNRILKLSGTVP